MEFNNIRRRGIKTIFLSPKIFGDEVENQEYRYLMLNLFHFWEYHSTGTEMTGQKIPLTAWTIKK
jgi:hypothetical protein